jgi:hypothetical protein
LGSDRQYQPHEHHLSHQIIEQKRKKKKPFDIENLSPTLGQAQICCNVKVINGFSTVLLLINGYPMA